MNRRVFIRGLSTLTAASAGLALLTGCGQRFWDRRPTVFEFVVNLETAHTLGISFPPDVAAQVTEWIQ